jgi:hypothetical protein
MFTHPLPYACFFHFIDTCSLGSNGSTKFLESMLSLIPFWRASPALVLECYEVVEGGFLYFDFLAPDLVSKVLNYSNNIFYNQQGQNRGKLLFTNVT